MSDARGMRRVAWRWTPGTLSRSRARGRAEALADCVGNWLHATLEQMPAEARVALQLVVFYPVRRRLASPPAEHLRATERCRQSDRSHSARCSRTNARSRAVNSSDSVLSSVFAMPPSFRRPTNGAKAATQDAVTKAPDGQRITDVRAVQEKASLPKPVGYLSLADTRYTTSTSN
jgi:hypothetical protein